MKRSALRLIADGVGSYEAIARLLGISQPGAWQRVRRLERAGYVTKTKGKHSSLKLTAAGRKHAGSAGMVGTVDLGVHCNTCGAVNFNSSGACPMCLLKWPTAP